MIGESQALVRWNSDRSRDYRRGDFDCPGGTHDSPRPGHDYSAMRTSAIWDGGAAEVKMHPAPLNHLAHLVRNRGKCDFLAVRLAARKRFGKVQSLLRLDLGGKWRLERIDYCLHDCRACNAEECVHGMTALARIFHCKSEAAAGMRERREIDRVQINAIFGIAEKNH